MDIAATAFHQIVIMFLLIIVGVICYKVKLIDVVSNKKLSNLVLMLVNPMVIFSSYQRAFDADLLYGLFLSIALAVATHIIAICISFLCVRGGREDRIGLERFAVVYSNCGFMGIPLVQGVFGSEGVFYVTAYLTVYNIFVWTQGVILVTGSKDKSTIRSVILNPSILATLLGFVCFLLQLPLPKAATETVGLLANLNSPLAMMVAGVTIAQHRIRDIFAQIRIYYIALLKLFVVPLVMFMLFQLFDLPQTVLLTSVLAAACPTGATGTLFAIRYGKDSEYASNLFTMTTLFCGISIPIVMMIAVAI